ncbi:MAG TPA: hypothetical protein IAB39_04095 [Candidatus Onthovicinus excrementipullorum]|nr:hypothetical protein [Candidatus Onthovicinus excrementipullorum]
MKGIFIERRFAAQLVPVADGNPLHPDLRAYQPGDASAVPGTDRHPDEARTSILIPITTLPRPNSLGNIYLIRSGVTGEPHPDGRIIPIRLPKNNFKKRVDK